METIDTIVIDKTGTLTEDKPAVTAIVPAPGLMEVQLLGLAASVERASEHPIAAGVLYPVFRLLLSPIIAAAARHSRPLA